MRSTAEAVLLFDSTWELDVESLQRLSSRAAWMLNVSFDEVPRCRWKFRLPRSRVPTLRPNQICFRAKGVFTVAGLPI